MYLNQYTAPYSWKEALFFTPPPPMKRCLKLVLDRAGGTYEETVAGRWNTYTYQQIYYYKSKTAGPIRITKNTRRLSFHSFNRLK
jgi:hypothetical protein